MTINFGTDGWRAVIADTFTFDNLRLVTQGVADAVSSGDWGALGMPKANGNGPHPSPSPEDGSTSSGEGEGPGVGGRFDPRLMVVGFATRFLSDRFAVEVARVLAANGFRVMLTHADAPTPAVSYAVKHAGAAGGVMITASHNAPRYNGLKLKAAYGG